MKYFIVFAYRSGWRISEIASLAWRQVDRHEGIVRLDVDESKIAEPGSSTMMKSLRTF